MAITRPLEFIKPVEKNKKPLIISVVLFMAILCLSINLRKHTFTFPHFKGDQIQYVGLAFKLDRAGMADYNLRGINIRRQGNYRNLIALEPAEGKGWILESLAKANIFYYDQPLHHIPFAFPAALMLSHRIFSPGEPFYLLEIPDLAKLLKRMPQGLGLKGIILDPHTTAKQFYSVIIPLCFSILLIMSVYFFARYLYKSEFIALGAMFLIAVSPVDILTSQRIWADDMTAFFAAASVLCFIISSDKNRASLSLLAGILCGLSAITKQNGALIIPVIVIWHLIVNYDKLLKKNTAIGVIFDKNLIFFGIGAVLTSGYWFLKITSTYGSPVYNPSLLRENSYLAETADWFKTVVNRPRCTYLVGIPYQNPFFILAYFSPLLLFIDKKQAKRTLLAIVWIAVFLLIFQECLAGQGKEHRYILPAYAAYAVLSTYTANRIRILIDGQTRFKGGSILFIILLLASGLRSASMGLDAVFYSTSLILKPF